MVLLKNMYAIFTTFMVSVSFDWLFEAELKLCKCAIIFNRACNYCSHYNSDCDGLLGF